MPNPGTAGPNPGTTKSHAPPQAHYISGVLDGPELAETLGVTLASANSMVLRLRHTVERRLGPLLLARGAGTGRHACPELAGVLNDWDGDFTVLMRKRIGRHIHSCPVCKEELRQRVTPAALLGGAAVFIPAPGWLRSRTLDGVRLPR
jgi:hypothetical protein